jgi:hypothetical protein
MRTSIPLVLSMVFAAGCGRDEEQPVLPPCGPGIVFAQQFPTQGLSAIEPLPNPEQVALKPNPALIDGVTDVGAGLDVGFGRTLAGDNKLRDIEASSRKRALP